jgi:hypothetical protein
VFCVKQYNFFYQCRFKMSSLLARFFCLQICIDGRQSAVARACHLLGLHLISCQGHRHLQLCPRGTVRCASMQSQAKSVPKPSVLNVMSLGFFFMIRPYNTEIIETKMVIRFVEADSFMNFKFFWLLQCFSLS